MRTFRNALFASFFYFFFFLLRRRRRSTRLCIRSVKDIAAGILRARALLPKPLRSRAGETFWRGVFRFAAGNPLNVTAAAAAAVDVCSGMRARPRVCGVRTSGYKMAAAGINIFLRTPNVRDYIIRTHTGTHAVYGPAVRTAGATICVKKKKKIVNIT